MSVSFDQAVMEGLDAAKPAASAGTVGRLYFATDTGLLYRDNGTAWVERANDLQLGTTATTAAAGNDSRLSDARTPTAHATSHAAAGSDPVTPAAIGAEPALGDPASDGYVLSSTAAGARSWVAPSGGGGGGATIGSGVAASRPAGTEGDLYIPTDGPFWFRKGASNWNTLIPGFAGLVEPRTADLTLLTAGGSGGAWDESKGGILVTTQPTLLRGYGSAVGSTFTVTLGYRPLIASSAPYAAIVLLENSTGKYVSYRLIALPALRLDRYRFSANADPNGSPATFTETSLNSLMLPPLFLIRVVQDASTRKGYVSYDQGQTWTQIYSDANTDYITPSHALMFGRFAGAHFLHWEVL